jgi:hypothetical protein
MWDTQVISRARATSNGCRVPANRWPETDTPEVTVPVRSDTSGAGPAAETSLPASGKIAGVQFSVDLRDRVADGTITVSYRLWSRPKVKVGGLYKSGSVMIEVDAIELLPFSSIRNEDLARTGEPDLDALRRRAAHAGPIEADTLLYRVEFHVAARPHKTG